ncbi:MAG TPA: cytochrome c biogenesis protein CcsA [Usitatibacter sp.]|nr:cytochrome c biogenesis protein CcsA [Usitatibacter sp.]
MPDLLLYFSTAAVWLLLAGMAWRTSRVAAAPGGPAARDDVRIETVLVPLALALNGLLLYRSIVHPDGLDMSVGNGVAMLVWLTVLIYWLAGLAFRGLAGILGLMAPIAFGAVVLQVSIMSVHHVVNYGGDPLFALHFAIAMLAYALYFVATVHALVMLAEEKWLHRGVLPPFIRSLPPLLEMEALLFRILLAAFVLLTLTVVSGLFFSDEIFGKPFTLTHKNVFAIISWFIFGGLLAGHFVRGWRGRTAVYWTLAGFTALMLAYVGSKAVLELILKRGLSPTP